MDVPEIVFSSEKKKPLKIGNKEYISANDFSLTEKELEKARVELSETEENKIRKLKELRDKLTNDIDGKYRTDTEYLLRFLRVRKYDCTKAYQNIKEGYKFRERHPEIFSASDLEHMLNRDMFRYLPYTDEEGQVLFHLHLEKWNCQEIEVHEAAKVLISIGEIIAMNPRLQVNGGIGIWDTNGLSIQHITTILSKFGLRELSFGIQNLFPWRLKKILILNTGQVTRLFYKMMRPFVSKKIYKRFIFLGTDIEEVHQYVDPALLPKGLGGFLEENQCSITQNILDNISYLKYTNSFASPGKL